MDTGTVRVAKFGGSSLASFDSMHKSAEIIKLIPQTRVVVLSASSGVTDLLLALCQTPDVNHRKELSEQIRSIQLAILQQLPTNSELNTKIDALLNNIEQLADVAQLATSTALIDEIVSHGELMSTLLFQSVLQQQVTRPVLWFDVRNVMYTDDSFGKAIPNEQKIQQLTEQHLLPLLQQYPNGIIITQGFIGRTSDSKTTTLGRGGSDYSAALLSEALKADRIDIWTDVAGIYTTDPRHLTEVQQIESITFEEAAEMATFGAKILHPATLIPAIRNNIPVFIGSSKNPQAGGTVITATAQNAPSFRAIATRKKQILLTLHSLNMLHARGFLAAIFNILAKHGIAVDLITTSEVKVALTLDNKGSSTSEKNPLTEALLTELSALCRVEIEENLALIAIIGNKLNETRGISQKVFDAMENIDIKMACFGASSHNICLLIRENELSEAITTLHRQLFSK